MTRDDAPDDDAGLETLEGGPPSRVDYESETLERSSYVMAIVHLYRGEVSRANIWRNRLDQTTHWAIFTTASALGFAFGNSEAPHFSLQFANLLLFILLTLEARRFRFFDVWRARIRKIETNFFAPILERKLASPEIQWAHQVAKDLTEPHFHLTRIQALRLRLVRNYLAIFGVILVAWVIKLEMHPTPAHTIDELLRRCEVGPVPAWLTLSLIAGFYLILVFVLVAGRTRVSRTGDDNWGMGEIVQEEAHALR